MADKRYIDADKLTFSRVRIIHSDGTIGGWHAVVMSSVIKDAPAADVVEVRHGEWKPCFEDWRKQIEGDECSACGFQHYGASIRHYFYCPNCGAKMDGGRKEQT